MHDLLTVKSFVTVEPLMISNILERKVVSIGTRIYYWTISKAMHNINIGIEKRILEFKTKQQ